MKVFPLELYHYGTISPYLEAKLQQQRHVLVIKINDASSKFNSCILDSLKITRLSTVTIVEPSTFLIPKSKEHILHQRGVVISTSLIIDRALAVASSFEGFKFHHIYSYESILALAKGKLVMQDILSKDSSQHLGKAHLAYILPFYFIHFSINVGQWSSYLSSRGRLDCRSPSNDDSKRCSSEVLPEIRAYLLRNKEHATTLLLDRPVGWIAFDGGLIKQGPVTNSNHLGYEDGCTAFNSDVGVKRVIRHSKNKLIVNIDLVLTSDNQNVAMHNNSSVGPISHSPSLVSTAIRNPCLSNGFIHRWFDSNPYNSYPEPSLCSSFSKDCSISISNIDAFINIILKENVSIIFDLKAFDKQDQLHHLMSSIHDVGRSIADVQRLSDNVSIRFFASNDDMNDIEIPRKLRKITSATKIRHNKIPKIFINTPSKQSCSSLSKWIERQGIGHLGGCFVIKDNTGVTKKWDQMFKAYEIEDVLYSNKDLKLICDVPSTSAHQKTRSLWRDGLVSCVEDGYDWIHHPFPVTPKVDSQEMMHFSVMDAIEIDGTLIANALSVFKRKHTGKKEYQIVEQKFPEYTSEWGLTSPYIWEPREQHFLFVGDHQQDQKGYDHSVSLSHSNDREFRCVTKILTVMLFLKLEEIGLLSIDDTVYDLNSQNNVKWSHIFTNTAGADGSYAGNKFEYSNSLWKYAPDFIETKAGVSFIEAISFYILDPMGLTGSFNVTTQYPPFAARGFLGSNEDLLTIGSTLASGGVSPKTRKRIISSSNVERMLRAPTNKNNHLASSFMLDKTFASMNRFRSGKEDDSFSSHGIVDGYAMGLWAVNGWRSRGHEKYPVRGWLSIGSSEALLYFDEDGIVVGMCSNRVLGLELTSPFAAVIRELGFLIDKAFKSHGDIGEIQLRGTDTNLGRKNNQH